MFANERTFLHYMQKGMFFSLLTISMLRHPVETPWGKVGLVLAAMTITYMIWAYGVFQGRMQVIRTRRNVKKFDRFDEPRGPLVVFGMMVSAMAVTAVYFVANFQFPNGQFFN